MKKYLICSAHHNIGSLISYADCHLNNTTDYLSIYYTVFLLGQYCSVNQNYIYYIHILSTVVTQIEQRCSNKSKSFLYAVLFKFCMLKSSICRKKFTFEPKNAKCCSNQECCCICVDTVCYVEM